MIGFLATLCLVLMVLLGLALQRLRFWHALAAYYLGGKHPTQWH